MVKIKENRLLWLITLCLLATEARANTLTDLIKETLTQHPSINQGLANKEAAEYSVDVAKWQYFPTPSVSVEQASASGSDPGYQGDERVSILRLQQSLWTAGRLTSGVDKAVSELSASQESLEETNVSLAMQVTQAYSEWLGAKLKIEATDKSIKIHQEMKDQISRRLKEGLSPESDFTLASSRLSQLLGDRVAAVNNKTLALTKLSQLIGRKVDEAKLIEVEAFGVVGKLDELLTRAIEISPTKRKLLHTIAANVSEQNIQASAMYPEVYARAEYQKGNFLYKGFDDTTRFFVGIQSNFGAGLSSASKVEVARARVKSIESELALHERSIQEQVSTEWSNYNNAQVRLASLNEVRLASENIRASWDRQFQTGRKSWLDVMNAARELAQTETQIADVRMALVMSSWRLAVLTNELEKLLVNNTK